MKVIYRNHDLFVIHKRDDKIMKICLILKLMDKAFNPGFSHHAFLLMNVENRVNAPILFG
ncbi:hypothetical protein B9T29_09395 [Acinetobacter sp. ANC 3903]|nr:hypothetical protein B9T29_09395 [Acinetobacter sp. ANC 3903]